MFSNKPMLLRFVLGILLPLTALAVASAAYLARSLPAQQGEIRIGALQFPVQVVRDAAGVPHLHARTDRDAFVAMGYVHAQDRLWQMEMQRRTAQGRLSEVLGSKALRTDQLMRTLGLARSASAALTHLNAAARDSLAAYAEGVNAWLREDRVLPLEFTLLDFAPEPWRSEDSLALLKLMALSLGGNFREELELDMLVRELGPRLASELHPSGVWGEIDSIRTVSVIEARFGRELIGLADDLERRLQLGGKGAGSNAWVVSGAHTVSGLPLLANDPHLATQIPSVWYLAELHGRDLHATGATLPGLPCVIFGHNRQVAWGGASMQADVQDLYVERVHPRDDQQYEYAGRWRDMQIIEERIGVRPEFPSFLRSPSAPLTWRVRSTLHGPLLSDVIEIAQFPVALRWTALDEDDTSYQALLGLNYAATWQAFAEALAQHVAPALNFVYADRAGNIGLLAAGRIPRRRAADGRLPVPGWNDQYEWQGAIAYQALPREFNPASGVLVTANNKNHPDDYPFLVSTSWAPPYRAQRIAEVIGEAVARGHKLEFADFAKLQGDVQDTQSREQTPFLASLQPQSSRQREALAVLAAWDGNSGADAVGASIYHTWLRHFQRVLIEDELRGELLFAGRSDALQSLLDSPNPAFLKQVSEGRLQHWCDDSRTAQRREDCASSALRALDSALDELGRLADPRLSGWDWGTLHHTKWSHSVFADVPLLDLLFNRVRASGGDEYTVNVAPATFSKSKGYEQFFGATYRQVIDVADWNRSGFITNTGQSGNVLSRHYDDLIARHVRLVLLPMRFDARSTAEPALWLQPAQQPRH